ncbi:MAG: PAS domain S-box protein [Janthinobacterium lividum]
MMNDKPANDAAPAPPPVFLAGAGKIGALIVAFDWSRTTLGPLSAWPGYLKTTVALVLRSPVPIVTLWGADGVMIYNESYSAFAGGRHPRLLGSRVRDGWPEVADFNDHVMAVVLAGGTLAYRDQELMLQRNGAPEPVWMNLDYSPVIDDDGRSVGVIAIVVETTAKVRAERYLSGERERLQRMFEQAPGFMAMLSGPRHVFELVNPAYMRLIGHRQVIGRPVHEVLPEISHRDLRDHLDATFASGEAFSANSRPFLLQRQLHATAEYRYVDVVYQPVRNDVGMVIGIFVQGTDVTDRVLAEQALKASENTFRILAQAVPNQVWAAPANGMLDWFNARAYEYCGVAPGMLYGRDWHTLIHPADVASVTAHWEQAVRDGTPYERELRLRRADGEYRWHLARAFAVRGEDGAVLRWVGTSTDIEDQKAAAESLSRHNQTLEHQVAARTADRDRIWRLSTDIMLVAGFDGAITAVNPAWTHLLGWSETELLGRPFLTLVHADDRDATRDEMTALTRGARTLHFENRYQRKDGGYSILSWAAVPDEGHFHAVGRDVTADRAAAAALRRTEAALYQSQKMETIGKLTGGVAHDFNNLLQVISGNLQLLAFDVKGQPQPERRVSNALAGVKRGAKLASHLLAFGRRQALEPKSLKIGRLVGGMEDMLRRSLGETIEIEMVISAGLWSTFVDPAHVENAILNLSINARDAMDGVGRLTIEVGNAYLDSDYAREHAELKPGQYVLLAVTDTGCGMPADVIAQAFEPFFSTKPEGKGTGLGLSMVYGFVKQSGGHVTIYSEPGHGTTVKLYLPRTLLDEARVEPVAALPAIGGVETILMAEDDAEVQATVIDMLTELGYRVLKANDASSALAIIESGVPIDLLFTDVVMPGPLRSPELARQARERLPDLAVLFTSGYTENAIVHGGRLDPGVELLGKPYTREALARKIRHVLCSRKQHRLQPSATPSSAAPDSPHAVTSARRSTEHDNDRGDA